MPVVVAVVGGVVVVVVGAFQRRAVARFESDAPLAPVVLFARGEVVCAGAADGPFG